MKDQTRRVHIGQLTRVNNRRSRGRIEIFWISQARLWSKGLARWKTRRTKRQAARTRDLSTGITIGKRNLMPAVYTRPRKWKGTSSEQSDLSGCLFAESRYGFECAEVK